MSQEEMALYQCHKQVRAFKILRIDPQMDGGARLRDNANTQHVDRKFVSQHAPEVGGYFVLYEDGYKSYSPAKAFEEGYSIIENNV
jgi:hypothetical protein